MPSKAEEIFDRAYELPAAKRLAYVEEACAGDLELRSRVFELLAALETRNGFLPPENEEEELAASPLAAAAEIGVGLVIDRYKLLEQLGEGGFGIVWAAQQLKPVHRRVALKIIKAGMDSKQVVARFEAERQALAMMDHPNIARVFDAGTTASGRPYFVMELIRGVSITKYCDQEKLSTEDRVELFIKTCGAIQHAHQKGIIHRDIKPSNVLVTLQDGAPVPKVIDFGIAKATQHQLTDKTVYTQLQQFVGSPAYMSPEQIEMSGLDIDTRSDIYSLGILLYELLAGQTPFDSKELLAVGLDEMRRVIREQEPMRPSSKVSTLAKDEQSSTTTNRRIASAPKLSSKLAGDLDWIVLKCLEKDRTRRYDTANGLANDLSRHLKNEPVSAQPPSKLYRLQKTWQRNRGAMTAAALVAVTLLIATGVAIRQAALATQAAVESERSLYAAKLNLIRDAWLNNSIGRVRQLLEDTASHPERGFEWYFWQQALRGDERTLRGHLASVDTVLFSPDGKHVFSGGRDNTVRIWDVETGTQRDVLTGHDGYITAMELSADGKTLYVGDWADSLHVWDWQNRRRLFELAPHRGDIRSMSLSTTGTLALGTSRGTNYLYDVSESAEPPRLVWTEEDRGNSVAISPDGTKLVCCSFKDPMRMRDLQTQADGVEFPSHSPALRARFSPEGKRILSVHLDGTASLWDLTGKELLSTASHRGWAVAAAFTPDGRIFATGSDDNSVKIWRCEDGALLRTLRGHAGRVRGVAFSPNGQRIATASHDRTVKLWDAREDRNTIPVPHESLLRCMALSPDGQRFVTGGEDQIAVIQHLTGREAAIRLIGHKDWLWAVAFSPDGQRVATCSSDATAMLWSATSGQPLGVYRHGERLASVTFSPDGKRIATGSWDGRVTIWATGDATKPLLGWQAHAGAVWALRYSPNGAQLATGGEDHAARTWNAKNGRALASLEGHRGAVRAVGWCKAASGRSLIATASVDSTGRIWDADRGILMTSLEGHTDPLWSISFSSDGRRVATSCGEDGEIRVWHTGNGHQLLLLDRLPKGVLAAEFTSDSRSLVAAFPDRQVRHMRTPSPDELHAIQQEEALAIARIQAGNDEPQKRLTSDALQPRLETPAYVQGTVNRWLVLSPIRLFERENTTELRRGMTIPFVPELQLSSGVGGLPRDGDAVRIGSREMSWRSVEPNDGVVDFRLLLGEGTWWDCCLAYAISYIDSPKNQSARLVLSDGDAYRVYLNGVLVHADVTEFGSESPHSDSIVELKQGRNILLLKHGNTIGPWTARLNLTDADEKPLRGLSFACDPE